MEGAARFAETMAETYGLFGRLSREANRPGTPATPPKICKVFLRSVDTSRLLLAFLAFGAACTTLWAWMLATSNSPAER